VAGGQTKKRGFPHQKLKISKNATIMIKSQVLARQQGI
jgi:hypothetical protein